MAFDAACLPDLSAVEGRRIALSIPGEMTDGFLSQIALFQRALRRLPAPYRDARILAYLGCNPGTGLPERFPGRWREVLRDVELRPVPHDGTEGYVPQARARFAEDDPNLDYIFLCDADTLPLGAFDAPLAALVAGAPVTGVIAHGPPPHFGNNDWNALANELTGKPLTFPYRYTIWQAPTPALDRAIRAPFYLNHGIVGFRAEALRAFHPVFVRLRAAVARRVAHPAFAGQMALTLAVHVLGWDPVALPLRYNFPNDDRALARHPSEAADLRHLHFLREERFRRETLLADPQAFSAFMAQPPKGADRLLYDGLWALTGGEYPF